MRWTRLFAVAAVLITFCEIDQSSMATSSSQPEYDNCATANVVGLSRCQRLTAIKMWDLEVMIHAFKEEHKVSPTRLNDVSDCFKDPESAFTDSWGRPFIYYTSGTGWVLISTGANGVVDGQIGRPGGCGVRGEVVDIDLVMINGAWAQKPRDFP